MRAWVVVVIRGCLFGCSSGISGWGGGRPRAQIPVFVVLIRGVVILIADTHIHSRTSREDILLPRHSLVFDGGATGRGRVKGELHCVCAYIICGVCDET